MLSQDHSVTFISSVVYVGKFLIWFSLHSSLFLLETRIGTQTIIGCYLHCAILKHFVRATCLWHRFQFLLCNSHDLNDLTCIHFHIVLGHPVAREEWTQSQSRFDTCHSGLCIVEMVPRQDQQIWYLVSPSTLNPMYIPKYRCSSFRFYPHHFTSILLHQGRSFIHYLHTLPSEASEIESLSTLWNQISNLISSTKMPQFGDGVTKNTDLCSDEVKLLLRTTYLQART
jgi:hypothetical protein